MFHAFYYELLIHTGIAVIGEGIPRTQGRSHCLFFLKDDEKEEGQGQESGIFEEPLQQSQKSRK
jgi:hypothetical protein